MASSRAICLLFVTTRPTARRLGRPTLQLKPVKIESLMWKQACEAVHAWRGFMSETLRTLIESLLMIGAISLGFVWYALVAARREDPGIQLVSRSAIPQSVRGASRFTEKRMVARQESDAHLGRCSTESGAKEAL
jgi:hypothetical protein